MNIYHYIFLGMFALFALADRLVRARPFAPVARWVPIGGIAMIAYLAVTTTAPFLWDEALGAHRLFDLTALGFWVQAAIGLVVMEAGIYAWHRTMHRFTLFWRFHQTHHSAERVDIWGAFYFHPLDMLGWALLGSLCLVLVVGLDPEPALAVNLAATFCAMFQHSNIRTPRWLGYLITRPESHAVHHQRGVHGYNYGDVPWFDIAFGTFRNPAVFEGEAGFHEGSSKRYGELLRGKLIS